MTARLDSRQDRRAGAKLVGEPFQPLRCWYRQDTKALGRHHGEPRGMNPECDLAKALAAVERYNFAVCSPRRPRSSAARKRLRRERRAA